MMANQQTEWTYNITKQLVLNSDEVKSLLDKWGGSFLQSYLNEFYMLPKDEQNTHFHQINIESRLTAGDKTGLLPKVTQPYTLYFNICKRPLDTLDQTIKDDPSCAQVGDSLVFLLNLDITGKLNPEEFPRCILLSNSTMKSPTKSLAPRKNVAVDYNWLSINFQNNSNFQNASMVMHYPTGQFCKFKLNLDPEISSFEEIYFRAQIEPICAYNDAQKQQNQVYLFKDEQNCTFIITIFVDCHYLDSPTASEQLKKLPSQRDYINAIYIFLDLKFNQLVFGIGAILIGLVFLTVNYQSNNKRHRNIVINLVCIIIGVCCFILPFYLIEYGEDFSLSQGWILVGFGFLAGQVLFIISMKVGIRLFTQSLGFLTGFCFANTIEICILFRAKQSYYVEYIVSALLFGILAQVFNVNIYNPMLSWCGAFFVCRGILILLYNDQIAEIKQFINDKGFTTYPNTDQDIINVWRPIYFTGGMIVIFLIAEGSKMQWLKRQFKIEQHPYYQIQ